MECTEAATALRRRTPRRPRTLWVVVLTLAAALAQVVGVPTPPAAASDAKIEAGLLALPDGQAVDFWVTFGAKADVGTAGPGLAWADRGRAVVDGLQRTSTTSQAGVARLLAARGVRFESYWIANTGKVHGPKGLMRELAARSDVAKVEADRPLSIPEPAPAASIASAGVEWNIAAINAPAVWSDLEVTGRGIVVANLDTGVQFDHPALVNQYRGNRGDGTFDHNYNWFDPSSVCGSPSLAPCDNTEHGTHTMGTMVGGAVDDQNAVGVAPGARWIAAKGCESNVCSRSALLAGGQWLLAPTDLNGRNPRPDLRPNIVNNSWAGPGGDTWYRDVVAAWVAAGIFPVFANGNAGPACGSAGSPGDYAESYAVGASDRSGAITSFSSRGSGAGPMKPDITAPGASVRSAVPGGGYDTLSGTSMAAPHVAGTVALMWSAVPALIGDVVATRSVLDASAVDVADLTCGGTAADNGVWGEGRLDALAAVLRSPRGPTGILSGTVVDLATGLPVTGARVRSVDAGTFTRNVTTSSTGAFTERVATGPVQIQVSAYGYASASSQVNVVADRTTVVGFSLAPLPRHSVSGRILDNVGAPTAASVSIVGAPVPPVVTDATGLFRFASIPDGDWVISASGRFCLGTATTTVHLGADTTVELSLGFRRDAFGYFCQPVPSAYVEADAILPLTGDDAVAGVTLPFPISYYGKTYRTAGVATNGVVGLTDAIVTHANRAIPDVEAPNATIYVFWDDLVVDGLSSVRTATLGVEPERRFVIEWRNVRFASGTAARFDFEVILEQHGGIVLQYRRLSDDPLVRGASATIGIENESGLVGRAYSFNEVALFGPAMALRFETPRSIGNTAPDAADDKGATVATHNVRLPVLANDSDLNGDPLQVTSVSQGRGMASVLPGNVVSYTPGTGFTGTDVLTYEITDGRGGADRATITVTVAPLAVDDTASTVEDTPVDIRVLANDLNPQGGTLAIYGVYGPPGGSAQEEAPGVVRYIPYANLYGSQTIEYAVTDGLGGLDIGAITITISPVDDPPYAGDDRAEVAQGSVTTVPVLANDYEFDGEMLQVVAVSDPPHGTAAVNPDGTITYRPDAGYAGPDAFTYDVSDGHTAVRAAVTMTVQAPITTTTTTTLPPTTTTTTRPPGTATMRAPYALWTQTSPAPLDGLGTWIGTLNDPAATAGQLGPEYLDAISFGFEGSPVRGIVGLTTGSAGKTAVVAISGAGVATQATTVPFNWMANHFYYLLVLQSQPGVWSAAVYDLAASTWTPIGSIVVPAGWGKLSPTVLVATGWTGRTGATCSAYPRSMIALYAPTAFRAGGTTDAVFVTAGAFDGTCRSDYGVIAPGWYVLLAGTP